MKLLAALRALLRRLFGRKPAPPPRAPSRDEIAHLVMDIHRELGKRRR